MNINDIRRDRLREIAIERGGERGWVAWLAETLNRSESQISQILGKNPTRNIGSRLARDIEHSLKLESGYLDVLMVKEEAGVYGLGNVTGGPARPYVYVPLISWVQAGEWGGIVDNFAPGDAEEWLPCPVKCGPKTFVLRVRGVSMEDKFHDGDLIFVDPDVQPENGSFVIVRLDHRSETTFKQLILEGEPPHQRRYLKPYNPNWPEKIIEVSEHATIVGVVVGRFVAI